MRLFADKVGQPTCTRQACWCEHREGDAGRPCNLGSSTQLKLRPGTCRCLAPGCAKDGSCRGAVGKQGKPSKPRQAHVQDAVLEDLRRRLDHCRPQDRQPLRQIRTQPRTCVRCQILLRRCGASPVAGWQYQWRCDWPFPKASAQHERKLCRAMWCALGARKVLGKPCLPMAAARCSCLPICLSASRQAGSCLDRDGRRHTDR